MTLWKKVEGFSFHYFEPLEDGPELKPFDRLVKLWRSKFDGDRIPRWADFDFTDFRGWHSRIAIYDVTYDPFDYVVRLSGESYNQAMGQNMKGVTRHDLLSIAVERETSDAFFKKTCTEMLIAYSNGVNVIDREHMNVEFLELPLSDNGQHATHTIEASAATRIRV